MEGISDTHSKGSSSEGIPVKLGSPPKQDGESSLECVMRGLKAAEQDADECLQRLSSHLASVQSKIAEIVSLQKELDMAEVACRGDLVAKLDNFQNAKVNLEHSKLLQNVLCSCVDLDISILPEYLCKTLSSVEGDAVRSPSWQRLIAEALRFFRLPPPTSSPSNRDTSRPFHTFDSRIVEAIVAERNRGEKGVDRLAQLHEDFFDTIHIAQWKEYRRARRGRSESLSRMHRLLSHREFVYSFLAQLRKTERVLEKFVVSSSTSLGSPTDPSYLSSYAHSLGPTEGTSQHQGPVHAASSRAMVACYLEARTKVESLQTQLRQAGQRVPTKGGSEGTSSSSPSSTTLTGVETSPVDRHLETGAGA